MKVIVAGGRDFSDYELVCHWLDHYLQRAANPTIISGSCDDSNNGLLTFIRDDGTKVYGADGLGERYAKERGLSVELYPADWKGYGRIAGPMRNRKMSEAANCLVAFWNGRSPGTKSMINIAKDRKLKVRVVPC